MNQQTTNQVSSAMPLAGIRVLDMGIHRAGPHCALILARLGAEVIKVEGLQGEQARKDGVKWSGENNTKESIAVNLRDPAGQAVVRRIARNADILVQNFRPGVMRAMGLDIEELLQECPRLIVVSISAYGADSSLRDLPGFDGIMQAASGMMYVNGSEDMPPLKFKSAIVDRTAGLHGAIGALAALQMRSVTGRGQSIDISLCQSGYSIIDLEMAESVLSGEPPPRTGNRASNPPINNAFRTVDGWVYIATAGRMRMWEELCRMIGKEEWLTDPRFATKDGLTAHVDLIESEVSAFVRNRTAKDVIAMCAPRRIPASEVKSVLDAARSGYVKERDVHRYIDTPHGSAPTMGDPWHFSSACVQVKNPPLVGEQTRDVLAKLGGYSAEEVKELFERKAVA